MAAIATVVAALLVIWLVSLTGVSVGVLVAVGLAALCVAGWRYGQL